MRFIEEYKDIIQDEFNIRWTSLVVLLNNNSDEERTCHRLHLESGLKTAFRYNASSFLSLTWTQPLTSRR
ncbi:unnamed protein product [Larinioides sclopetarius]|uniref:Uncharacterized protein n=1 Tax=Larinioides sclopetarius TaxID=280406 RepID=A0AAV1Z2F8_9ARAC